MSSLVKSENAHCRLSWQVTLFCRVLREWQTFWCDLYKWQTACHFTINWRTLQNTLGGGGGDGSFPTTAVSRTYKFCINKGDIISYHFYLLFVFIFRGTPTLHSPPTSSLRPPGPLHLLDRSAAPGWLEDNPRTWHKTLPYKETNVRIFRAVNDT